MWYNITIMTNAETRTCHGADERKYDRLQRCIASKEELELGTAEGDFAVMST